MKFRGWKNSRKIKETGVITAQPEELPITAETHEISHTFNEHNSSASSLSSTLAKNLAKVIGKTEDLKKLDRARYNHKKNLNSKALQKNMNLSLLKCNRKSLQSTQRMRKDATYTRPCNWVDNC